MTASPESPVVDRGDRDDAHSTALLTLLHDRLRPRLALLVEEFYARLVDQPSIAEVVDRLRPEELAHLKERQAEHLHLLVSPRVTEKVLHERSRAVGRIHAMVGVEIDVYVAAVADHRRTLLAILHEQFVGADFTTVHTVLGDRLMTDLQGALQGFRDLDSAQHGVMWSVSQAVSQARTVVDLARGVLEAISCLEGISVGFFGRPDAAGRLQFEIGAGVGMDDFVARASQIGAPLITTEPTRLTGLGPGGRAWRSGSIERCDSYMTDPSTVPWRDMAERFGWRSTVAIPLVDRRGTTLALVWLYARWPGYFASVACTTMLQQIKQSMESALSDLEERPALASAVSAYEDRATHLDRLAAGEVQMVFQPVVALPSGRVTKLEALARLRGPEGLVSPAVFLPAFGDDELFDLFEIGVQQSLDAVRTWEAAGLVTGVSVNLPVASAVDDRYVRAVAQLLEKYAVAPHRLTLELLETGSIDRDLEERRRSFDDFKELGVRLAQDDLGSGYSSLLRLRDYAFDDVKIDQNLVRSDGPSSPMALHFIRPISNIAHSLGLSVVVEGLENEGLIEAAVQLGVDEGQGYGIAYPMPADVVVEWDRSSGLDIDPAHLRTPLGALATHVTWEHRVSVLGGEYAGVLAGLGTCGLTAYVARSGRQDLADAHQALHAVATGDRGGPEHRAVWEHLATLLLV